LIFFWDGAFSFLGVIACMGCDKPNNCKRQQKFDFDVNKIVLRKENLKVLFGKNYPIVFLLGGIVSTKCVLST
jgi:hypothetical protein